MIHKKIMTINLKMIRLKRKLKKMIKTFSKIEFKIMIANQKMIKMIYPIKKRKLEMKIQVMNQNQISMKNLKIKKHPKRLKSLKKKIL